MKIKVFTAGRYETSNLTSTDGTTVKVVAGTGDTGGNTNWYHNYAQQRDYATNKGLTTSIGSTMIQGASYDQVMKFVDGATDGNGNTYDVTTYSSSRHSGSFANTGTDIDDKVKNIYDLEGHVRAWTTEAYSSDSRIWRGGTYSGSKSASYRDQIIPCDNSIPPGTICQLYVK